MTQEEQAALWQSRARLILQVQAGNLTVKEAARQMGVSRKTYYEWEGRALGAMAKALENGKSGRPERPRDPEKEALQKKVDTLEKDLLVAKQTVEVRDMLRLLKGSDKTSDGKKNKKSRKK